MVVAPNEFIMEEKSRVNFSYTLNIIKPIESSMAKDHLLGVLVMS